MAVSNLQAPAHVAPNARMPFPKVLMFRTHFRCHLLQEAFLDSILHSYTDRYLLWTSPGVIQPHTTHHTPHCIGLSVVVQACVPHQTGPGPGWSEGPLGRELRLEEDRLAPGPG